MGQKPIRGTRAGEGIDPSTVRYDIKPWSAKIGEVLSDRNWVLGLMAVGPLAVFYDTGYWFTGLLWVWMVEVGHCWYSRRDALPMRLPMAAECEDTHNPIPGGKGYKEAEGIYFLGNEQKTNEELWLTRNDMLTHCLLMGTTGSGKTETLVSMAFNALATGSGLIYVDPKAAPKLAYQIWQMARYLGREDDFLVLNFGVAGKAQGHRLSNTTNPFSFGSAETLTELLTALMPAGGDQNAVFASKGQAIIAALMFALVDLRDKKLVVITPRTIRKHLNDATEYIKLSEDKRLTEFSQEALKAALATCNYSPEMPMEKQKSFFEQFGYGKAYFGQTLSSLADTYGHIYDVIAGEVDFRDVINNRRILVVLLPAMEKSPIELANLGKITLSALKAAAASGLGMRIEGTKEDVLDSLTINNEGTGPFLSIVDEYAAIVTPGFEILLTQGRSLGMATIVASQDYAGVLEADKKGAQQIIANTNTKIFMKLQDPEKTFELLKGLAGEEMIAESSGYDMNEEMGDFKGSHHANLRQRSRVDLRDLMEQSEGEAHIVWGGQLIRGRTFFADPDLSGSILTVQRKIQMDEIGEE